eukprot:TRINITY_DN10037_c0_g1_i1.p2 TRINITY_DN10037_c0_g1~~TRINITY_DN10037_c0_g1_i1.p2  ORF type:complete len:131 (+),score=9.17 TRINITY_DN10037_c0_g1_i1:126-518(+)
MGSFFFFFFFFFFFGDVSYFNFILLATGWVVGMSADATVVVVVGAHPDVPRDAPAGAPRVLDDVVIARRASLLANSSNGMVQGGGAAPRRAVDASLVQLERGKTGVNGHRRHMTNDARLKTCLRRRARPI